MIPTWLRPYRLRLYTWLEKKLRPEPTYEQLRQAALRVVENCYPCPSPYRQDQYLVRMSLIIDLCKVLEPEP